MLDLFVGEVGIMTEKHLMKQSFQLLNMLWGLFGVTPRISSLVCKLKSWIWFLKFVSSLKNKQTKTLTSLPLPFTPNSKFQVIFSDVWDAFWCTLNHPGKKISKLIVFKAFHPSDSSVSAHSEPWARFSRWKHFVQKKISFLGSFRCVVQNFGW